MTDVERVRVDVVVDALGHSNIAVEELAEKCFRDLLLGEGELGLQGIALL
jgi:hypothetical protein